MLVSCRGNVAGIALLTPNNRETREPDLGRRWPPLVEVQDRAVGACRARLSERVCSARIVARLRSGTRNYNWPRDYTGAQRECERTCCVRSQRRAGWILHLRHHLDGWQAAGVLVRPGGGGDGNTAGVPCF